MSTKYQYETVKIEVSAEGIAHFQLNRPKKLNAFNDELIADFRNAFREINRDSNVSVVVVSGSGRMFTAGLDLTEASITKMQGENEDAARKAYRNREHIEDFQDAFTAIELCPKPVIAAVHSACFGAGVDLITACDIRYCTKDSFFCVKEVDVGLAADVGSLQRLPKVIGNQSLVRELCFTGRNMYAEEALQAGLVSKVLENQEAVLAEAFKIARDIASKSPVAIVGTKHLLNYSRDHTVAEGLAYTVTWNAPMLNTEDIPKSIQAFVSKKPATYSKL
ncbi:ClpP/crotonase-like domain-containing protein [Gilbertella persicaria]|uniref:ClpP/crotonase-like domain-containing protein n=1 Tax=Gilbertella persicaria TaxID=101096 RepID=UPI00221F03CC|nr:ClpP/crotonase-like domain-containing protein [Gilbertella persicaria]KAI8049425.1 ClpP/crotonase-like domain-containing protein [Gilbertella persicaria]